MKPKLHLALDTYSVQETLDILNTGIFEYADMIECGSSLIFAEGLKAVVAIKNAFPSKEIVADMKMSCEMLPYYAKQFKDALTDSMILVTSNDDNVTLRATKIALENNLKIYMYLNLNENEIVSNEKLENWKKIGLTNVIFHQMHTESPYWRESDYKCIKKISDYGFEVSVTGKITPELIGSFKEFNIHSFIIGTSITNASDPVAKIEQFINEINDNFN